VTFWVAFAVGTAVIVQFGVVGVLRDIPATTARVSFVKWIVGADVAHDLVIAPLACAAGWLISLCMPRPARLPVQSACFASAVVLVVVQNALRGTGSFKHNPTVQPLDYASSTATALGVVWLIAVAWTLVRLRRGARTP
jgi:hypothetical protein